MQITHYHSVTVKAKNKNVDASQRMSYFNNSKSYIPASGYDQTFHFKPDFNPKLQREDMQHTQVGVVGGRGQSNRIVMTWDVFLF